MAEPEKTPSSADAVGPPAAAAAADGAPANPPPAGDAAAAATNPAEATGPSAAAAALPAEGAPPAEGVPPAEGAPSAAGAPPVEEAPPVEGAPPAEAAPSPEPTPEELAAIEAERIRLEEEAKQQELERMRLEDIRIRELAEIRRQEEEDGKRIVAARLRMLVEFQNQEIHGMRQENLELQRRVVQLQKKRKSTNVEQFILEGQDAYYYAHLTSWNETKYEFGRMKDDYDRRIENLRDMLQGKSEESNARHEGMIHFIWKVARESQDIVSFQRIRRRVLQELDQEERDSIAELQAVRTRGRLLKSNLAKLELKLALKDQLQLETGNLHLVDYEQLKMENESLNQKIHMKNEALSTLKKKTTFLVHALQHIREKLQFLVVGCKVKGQELANAEKALHGGRITNSYIKTSIVNINRKRDQLQKGVVNIKSPMIWDDMDYQREDIEAEQQTFEDLKKRYHYLTVKIHEYRNCLYALKAIPIPVKKVFTRERPPTPPVDRGALRWGNRREVLGQQVVQEMVDLVAEQNDAKPKYDFGS